MAFSLGKSLISLIIFASLGAALIYGPFGAGRIESALQSRIASRLAASDLDWVEIRAEGQTIILAGAAPSDAARARAIQTAQQSTGPGGWLMGAVVKVDADGLTAAASPPPQPRASIAPATEGNAVAASATTASDAAAPSPHARAELCQNNLDITTKGRTIRFASNSSKIAPADRLLLTDLAKALAQCGPVTLVVEGHTDNSGSAAANLTLSQERADAVRDFLAAAGGGRLAIATKGYGQSRPTATNKTPAGREENRRIEFIVQPLATESE